MYYTKVLKLFFNFQNKYFRNIASNPCKVLNIYVMVFCNFLLIVQETPAAKRPPPLGQITCFPWCRHCSRVSSVPEHLTPLITTASADESPCQYHVSCYKRSTGNTLYTTRHQDSDAKLDTPVLLLKSSKTELGYNKTLQQHIYYSPGCNYSPVCLFNLYKTYCC